MEKIGILTENLLVFDKIANTCEGQNCQSLKLSSMQNLKDFCQQFAQTLVLLDLDFPELDYDTLKETTDFSRSKNINFMGFFPHVRIDLKEMAEQAGIVQLYPKSYFFSHLTSIIRELSDSSR